MLKHKPLLEEFAAFVHTARRKYNIPVVACERLYDQLRQGEAGTGADDFIHFYIEDTALTLLNARFMAGEDRRRSLEDANHYNDMANKAARQMDDLARPDPGVESALMHEREFHNGLMSDNVSDAVASSIEISAIDRQIERLRYFAHGLEKKNRPILLHK